MEQRSTFVTVVGWIFIVFSGFCLLEFITFSFLPFDKLLAKTQPLPGTPAVDPSTISSIMHGMYMFLAAIALWVLLSSIGLVMRKNWARISFMVILVINLIFCGLYLLIGLLVTLFMPNKALPGQPPEMAGFIHGLIILIVIFSAIFAGLYGWILYKLNTEKIRQEFVSTSSQAQS